MLFGTYQEIPYDENKKYCDPWEVKRSDNIVWLFPIENPVDAYVHSLFTAPNYPQVFYFIETDNFIRLNKIKHYKDLSKNIIKEYTEYIDDNIDNMHAEFVITTEEFQKSIDFSKVCFCTGLSQFKENGEIGFLKKHISLLKDADEEFEALLYHVLQKFTMQTMGEFDKQKIKEMYKNNKLIMKNFDEFINMKIQGLNDKRLFESTLLPFLSELILKKQASGNLIKSLYWTQTKSNIIYNKFAAWSYGDCNVEEYDALFQEVRKLVITNDDILKLKKMPERNEICPCGSGKKFKKCHGILF